MKDFVLEACVDSVESALAAVKGGANRLELCSNLVIGGTTPSQWLYEEIRKESDIRIHALIRPRFGDFCYTDHEFEIIRNEVRMFRKLGAEGVVIGILRPDGTLNMEEMEKLMEDAGDMSVTLHRAAIRELQPYTGAHAFHMTGKVVLESSMQYRKEGVNMGLPSLSEFEIFRTDAEKIREARKVLEEL